MTAEPVACIRREHSSWTRCRCPECLADCARRKKRLEAGLLRRFTSDEAWQVLDRMVTRSWSAEAIASATGISVNTVSHWLGASRQGHRPKIGAGPAERIVRHSVPDAGNIGPVGTVRRLRALMVVGYDQAGIAEECKVARSTVSVIVRGRGKFVRASLASRVADAYDRLQDTPGPHAGWTCDPEWLPPAAWTDIDDPAETPQTRPRRPGRRHVDVGEARELLDLGWSQWDVARAFRVQLDSLQIALSDAGQLPHRRRSRV